MEADIAVEQQTLRIAPRQVVVGFMLGVGAILAAVFTGLKLFLGK